jgi:hypothetical protein
VALKVENHGPHVMGLSLSSGCITRCTETTEFHVWGPISICMQILQNLKTHSPKYFGEDMLILYHLKGQVLS